MQTKSLLLTTSIVALVPAALLAADFWQKPAAEWSEKDCSRLVARSPWAKDTIVATGAGVPLMGGGGGGGRGRGGGGGLGGGAGRGGSAGEGEAGIGAGAQQAPEAPHVVVRWDSAPPIREAMKRVSVTKAVEDADAQAFYIVTVDGLRLGGRRRDANGNEGAGPPAGRRVMSPEMQDRLKAATSLTAKGKDAINPGKIDSVPGDGGSMTIRFYFPRSADFSLDDKELSFLTRVGPMEVKQKFVLKEMTLGGKLAL